MIHPKVTVVIPTFNRWPYVCEAIDSVLRQTYEHTECFIVDDFSTDFSYENIVNKYKAKVKIVKNHENKEKSFSRNRGVKECDADLVCFLDSDDLLTENSIEVRVKLFIEDLKFDGVSFGYRRDNSQKAIFNDKNFEKLSLEQYIKENSYLHINNIMLSRSNMLQYGMFNTKLTNREDVELFVRLLCSLEFRYCKQETSIVRKLTNTSAQTNFSKIIEQKFLFSEAIENDDKISIKLDDSFIKKIKRDEFLDLMRAYYRSGQNREFRKYFWQAKKKRGLKLRFKDYRRYFFSYLK